LFSFSFLLIDLTMPDITIQQVNAATAAVAFVVKQFFPLASPVTAEAALVTQIGATIVAVNNQTSQLELFGTGFAASGPVLALTAKVDGFLLAMGTAAVYGSGTTLAAGAVFSVGALALTLTVTAGVIAAATNKTSRDILTDPDFWNTVGQGDIKILDAYVHDRAGISFNALLTKLMQGFLTGEIVGLDKPAISPTVNSLFTAARNFILRLDPLVLDLDGDGLELTGANGSVLFDHNADGIKTGTGWAKADDGFLVRDINGNGLIDTGRELFGVDTIKRNNTLATDGFDALRDIDSNSDGVITSLDTAFNELKVWRDLDQNGTTSANELFTLGQLGITRINTAGTPTGPQAGQVINNNQVALSSTFTQNGQTRTVGAIDLEANNFFTQFPTQVVDTTGNPITITPQAQGLPQMKGSGMVRDMRAAASCRNSLKTRKQRDVREEKGSRCRESLVRRYRKKTNRTANVIYVVTA
jgi:hypothetical protein